jgi:hypothetical protein
MLPSCRSCARVRVQENIRANLCKLLDAHPSVINIKVCRVCAGLVCAQAQQQLCLVCVGG